jgi:hypothetical protein
MNIHDENTHLRHIATALVADNDNIHPAHAENRVMAAMRLAEAFARNSGVAPVAWTMAEMTEAGWVALSERAGLTRTASSATRRLAALLVTAEGLS